jgi:DNA-directed RNA polymerase specialized sigma24 family protein
MGEHGPNFFATTQWTLVFAAGGSDDEAKNKALSTLCTAYWGPVYAYIRRRGASAEESKDLTQEFFARLIRNEWLAGLTREGSKFRAFLLVAVKRFLAVEYERRSALKRGGGAVPLSIDDAELSLAACAEDSPERAFDRRWALTLIERAAARLANEAKASGREALFAQVSGFLAIDPEPGAYELVARNLGISRASVAMAVHRLRLRLREQVRFEVAETLASTRQIDEEVRELMAALRPGR